MRWPASLCRWSAEPGRGRRLFPDGFELPLTLLEERGFRGGVTLSRYASFMQRVRHVLDLRGLARAQKVIGWKRTAPYGEVGQSRTAGCWDESSQRSPKDA